MRISDWSSDVCSSDLLSVGLLGIALVQTRALANNNSSMGRSLATVATYSILEAIRADRANLAAYSDISVEGGSCAAGGSTLHEQQINAWCKELADQHGDRKSKHLKSSKQGASSMTSS